MAGKSFLFAVAFVICFRHNCNEPLSAENIFTDTAFCKSVVCVSVSVQLDYCIFPSSIGRVYGDQKYL